MGIAAATLAGRLLAGEPVRAGFGAAVSVLIIACPCALGLATPAASMVGAQLGILVTSVLVVSHSLRLRTFAGTGISYEIEETA